MNHCERILVRVLNPNFVGAMFPIKSILVSKLMLFDIVADISLEEIDALHDILVFDYGDIVYRYKLTYEYRDSSSNGFKYSYYVIKLIEVA